VTARDRLLDDVLAYARAHGLGDVSLRTLATAIGSSHRMLIYHFGSREGLLAAVVARVEADQRGVLTAISAGAGADPVTTMRRFWAALADPDMHESERLFFETVALSLRDRPGTEGLRESLVLPWLEAVELAAEQLGRPPGVAAPEARVGMALVRGLLLDLLATGDRDGVDAAMELFIARWWPASPAAAPPGPGTPPSAT
jgi:AcrR family transcriptional regulator